MLIDLTLAISMDDPVVGKASMDQHSFMSAGHIGTHLDSYLQTTIPTEFHMRNGKVFDAREFVARDTEIDPSVLGDGDVDSGDFPIFFTGALGAAGYGTREYFANHPQLSWELIHYLLERRVSFIGIDAAGVRRGEEHGIADRMAEQDGTYIIENLANLGSLSTAAAGRPFSVFTGWTGLGGFSGLQCRIIADVPAA